MAIQQIINVGEAPNDGLGDPIRTAFEKTNENFSTLFATAGITGIANGTSNVSIPVANSSILFAVGNTANIVVFQANGAAVTGNLSTSQFLSAGNITTSGTIVANGTIQSLGAVTAVTVTASGNLVSGNLNTTNQIRASTLSLTGNVVGAQLNVTGNVAAANIIASGKIESTSGSFEITGFEVNNGNISATGSNLTMSGFSAVNGNITATGSNLTTSGFSAVNGNIVATGSNLTMSGFSAVNGNIVGTGALLQVSGFSANSGAITVAANASISGNVSAPFFIGNGSQLTGVTAAPANIFNIINITGSNLVIADSPNDTLNMTFGNNLSIVGNSITDTIHYSFSENPSFTGQVTARDFVGDLKGTVVADDSTIMVDAVDNKLFGSEITSSGNVYATYFVGNGAALTGIDATSIQNGTSNVRVISANGNVVVNVAGNVITTTHSGGITVTGLANIQGNIETSGDVSATGNISANTVNAVNAVLSGNVSANNVNSGNVSLTGNVLSTLNVSANVNTAGLSSTGNVHAPYFIGNVIGNITGNLAVAGANTFVIFNDNGVANSTSGFTFDKSSNLVTVGGNVTATGNITGSYFVGNGALLTGVVTNSSTILNGNSNVSVSFNGNVSVSANGTPNVISFTDTGTFTSRQISSAGNVTAANIRSDGVITAVGNVTAPYFIGNVVGNISGNLSVSGGNTQVVFNDNGVANATSGFTFDKATNAVSMFGNLTVSGNTNANLVYVNSGNIAGTVIVNSGGNGRGNIGSSTGYFNTIFATATTALYADLAEYFSADQEYPPGTVLKFGGSHEVTISTDYQDTQVAGVVSENPSYAMNAGMQANHPVIVALAGRVPCRVQGPVSKGDLLVTSSTQGVAEVCLDPKVGTVIGKAIQDYNSDTIGTIEIVVGVR